MAEMTDHMKKALYSVFDSQERYYDREGKPISMAKWSELFEDQDYKIVKQTKLKNGVHVSTVWLGLDHNFSVGNQQQQLFYRPAVFETMIFGFDSGFEPQWRYSSEEEALEHHLYLVVQLMQGTDPEDL